MTSCTKYNNKEFNPPLANFTITDSLIAVEENVSFTDLSINVPSSWLWYFGDASSSTQQNPSHTYTNTGIYTVSLQVKNSSGTDQITKSNLISVGSMPIADFTSNFTNINAGATVNFTDLSSNFPDYWEWNFGDGTTSFSQISSHTYNTVGSYTVSLTVSNIFGSNAKTKANYIIVISQNYSVGNNYEGGVIAYIYQTGESGYIEGEVHGLIAAPTDQSTGAEWGCYGTLISGTSTGLGSGQTNTSKILNICSSSNIAAYICNSSLISGIGGWYLPSKEELNKLYLNKDAIGGFTNNYYWSSTESDLNYAWRQTLSTGNQGTSIKTGSYHVRCVKSF